ncbi:cation diffusion facilitator family transporter [soil metagenome]
MTKPYTLANYAWLSIAAALVTFGLKMLAWWLTGSVGLMSDAMESLVNLAAAVITLFSVTVSVLPADDEHAYGHTKVEYFASGLEGALILLAATGIGWNAIHRLMNPHVLETISAGLLISVLASVINLVVGRLLMKVGKDRHSVALLADGQHLMTDVWTSVAVVIAVGMVAFTGWQWLDPVIGILLAGHIIGMGVRLVRESMMGLMDTGLPPEEMKIIRGILDGYAEQGMAHHALRTRQAGAWRFMSVHLLMPGEWTIARGHDIADHIEEEIRSQVPRLNVLTHLEPLEDPASWDDVEIERKASPKK